MAQQSSNAGGDMSGQTLGQVGQAGQQVLLRIDERNTTTSYANAFRTNATPEEVVLDFGINQVVPRQQGQAAPAAGEPAGEILFTINNRVILNYYTAKRLAITLGQVIRRHEEQFGELKLNANERMIKPETR